jgi:lysophospholipase
MNPSGFVTSRDGLELAWRSWPADRPRGALVIVHGLAEHGMRYAETAGVLSDAGWSVYSVDLRSHGLSPDPPRSERVHVDRFGDFVDDVEAMVALARERHPGQPVFLLGHSMGGLVSLTYLLARPEKVQGAIISSPALGTHPDFQPPAVLRALVGVISALMPRKTFPSELDTQAVCRDSAVVEAYENDPLVTDRVSARCYTELVKAMQAAHRDAGSLARPVLLMQSGDDRLVDPAAPARWAAATPPGLVDLVTWPGFYHEMLNDPDRGQVWQKILDWLGSVLDVVDVDLAGETPLEKRPGHSGGKDQ